MPNNLSMNISELPTNITFNLQQGLLMHSIIDVVSRRGGFVGDELKPVGELFEYIKKELQVEQHLKRIQNPETVKQKTPESILEESANVD